MYGIFIFIFIYIYIYDGPYSYLYLRISCAGIPLPTLGFVLLLCLVPSLLRSICSAMASSSLLGPPVPTGLGPSSPYSSSQSSSTACPWHPPPPPCWFSNAAWFGRRLRIALSLLIFLLCPGSSAGSAVLLKTLVKQDAAVQGATWLRLDTSSRLTYLRSW